MSRFDTEVDIVQDRPRGIVPEGNAAELDPSSHRFKRLSIRPVAPLRLGVKETEHAFCPRHRRERVAVLHAQVLDWRKEDVGHQNELVEVLNVGPSSEDAPPAK